MVSRREQQGQGIVEFAALIKLDTANLLVNRNILPILLLAITVVKVSEISWTFDALSCSTVDLVVKNAVLDKENAPDSLAAAVERCYFHKLVWSCSLTLPSNTSSKAADALGQGLLLAHPQGVLCSQDDGACYCYPLLLTAWDLVADFLQLVGYSDSQQCRTTNIISV